MQYKDVLADFAERTLKNLEQIRRLEQGQRDSGTLPEDITVYPVTQQINSLLGLIVFPKEGYSKHIPKITLAELEARGWPKLRIVTYSALCPSNTDRCNRNHGPCTNLAQLIRVLRNGIAHFNIDFHSAPNAREIESVTISNVCLCCSQITASVSLTVEEISELAEKYAQLMISSARGFQV